MVLHLLPFMGHNSRILMFIFAVNARCGTTNSVLKMCGLALPKRTSHYICPDCTIPKTIPWHHHKYINTCNGLTIILLHSLQHPQFLDKFGKSEIEKAIKGSVQLMIEGKVYEGKTAILDFISSKIDTTYNESKIDFIGNEYDKFLCL